MFESGEHKTLSAAILNKPVMSEVWLACGAAMCISHDATT